MKWFLISDESTKKISSALTTAIAICQKEGFHVSEKDMRNALMELDTGLHETNDEPSDYSVKPRVPCD